MGIEGEIDEQALEEKRSLFESRSHANNVKRLTGLWPCILRWDCGRVRSLPLARGHRSKRTGPSTGGALAPARGANGAGGSRRTAVIACSQRCSLVRVRLRVPLSCWAGLSPGLRSLSRNFIRRSVSY
jgi:hypothetical protein